MARFCGVIKITMAAVETIYRVARTRDELEQAFALVYKEYKQRGYIPSKYKSRLRLSFYNALPATTTFVAKQGRQVVASATLIPDSPLGIPMDKLYREELNAIRKTGTRRIAEVSQLAINTHVFGRSLFSMFNLDKLLFIFRLFRVMYHYAVLQAGITDLCIAVNPKQQYLYKFLYLEQIGGVKEYGTVNRAPAIALQVNLQRATRQGKCQRPSLYQIFCGGTTPLEHLRHPVRLSVEDLAYLFVRRSDIFAQATPEQLAYLQQCYPADQDALRRVLATCRNGAHSRSVP